MPSAAPARILAAAAAGLALALSPLAVASATAASDTLTLGMSVDQEFAHSGSSLTYTLTIENSGPGSAENVVVADQIPDALTVTGASNGGTIAPPGDVVEWPAFTIASGDTLTLTVDAQVNDGFTNTVVTNTFTVTGADGFTIVVTGACVSEDQACAQTEIQSRADAEPPVVTPELAATGAEPGIPLLAAAALLLAGAGFLAIRRRALRTAR